MGFIITFFTFCPLHFWNAINLLLLNPSDLGLLVAMVYYGGLTFTQYYLIYHGILWAYDRLF
jgi:hypothetical protein